MSYILDALRRLEKDKEIAQKGINPMEAVLAGDPHSGRISGGHWAWWFTLASFVLITIIVSTYFITRQFLLVPDVTEQGLPPSQVEEMRGLEAAIENQRAGNTRVSLPAAKGDSTEKSIDKPLFSEKSAMPKKGAPPDGMSAHPRKPLPFTPQRKATAAPEIMVKQREVERSVPPPLPQTEVYRPWLGEEIKISAIAYSQEPKSRFAIVNLKTVRQGDRVAGLEISEIQEDGIVFIQDGDKYKIFLGRR